MSDNLCLGHMIDRQIVKITEQGAFIDGGEYGDLFIPKKQLKDEAKEGNTIRVFLYKDGARVLATARHPYLECGMIGRLTVSSIDCGTVYMDLGIPKELVVPVSEQRSEFEVGSSVLILVAMDEQGRLFGTQRYNRYFKDYAKAGEFKVGQRVTAVAVSHTPLGYRVVVNDRVYGLMYKSELKAPVRIGKRTDAYIVKVREDGRLDVSLQEPGLSGVEHAAKLLLKILNSANGFIPFNDKSDPQEIEDYLHMSKGKFKKAIGNLYKQHLIELADDGIRLVNSHNQNNS
ncbi:MAG: S1 RNA-binding domain-containing protein [Succinivibrio sp.]